MQCRLSIAILVTVLFAAATGSAGPAVQRARHGGTELSLILATLRANHVSTWAPAGFEPATTGTSSH